MKRKYWAVKTVVGLSLSLMGGALGATKPAPDTAPDPKLVMKEPAVNKALRTLLKSDYNTYTAMIAEPGKGKKIGRDYYGSACLKGKCDAGYATLFVDRGTGAVYAAWTKDGRLFFRPAIEKWPKKAEMAYEFWPEI